jgi:urease accessory protein
LSSPISGTAPDSTPWWAGSAATSSSSPERAAPARVGRDGRLDLAFERRDGRTILTRRRFTLPLQALEPLYLDGAGAATMVLLNPTGGVLGGDVLETRVDVGASAHVCLTTAAATQVYRARAEPSRLRLLVRVGAGGVLEHVPDHLIPSPGARLVQETVVELLPGATALVWDGWAAGRVARGETWGFDRLDTTLTVRDTRGLVLHDRARLDGRATSWAPQAAEGMAYVGTFAVVCAAPTDWSAVTARLQQTVDAAGPAVLGGATTLGRGGALVRFLAVTASAMSGLAAAVWAVSRHALLGAPPLALRKL